jgi:acyl carrier protein
MSMKDLTAEALGKRLAAELVRLRPHLGSVEIRQDASLTQDLGLDSLDLSALFSYVKSNVADVDLTPWFLAAARQGGDSLGSLAAFLVKAQKRAA